jgi:hypothetical protein
LMTWATMYFNSKNANSDTIAIIGLVTWSILSLIYFLYLRFISN